MTIDDKIRDEKLQYDILTEKQQKYQHYLLKKLINMNILQVNRYYLLIKEEWQNELSLHILHQEKLLKNDRRARKKQIDTITNQKERLRGFNQ